MRARVLAAALLARQSQTRWLGCRVSKENQADRLFRTDENGPGQVAAARPAEIDAQ